MAINVCNLHNDVVLREYFLIGLYFTRFIGIYCIILSRKWHYTLHEEEKRASGDRNFSRNRRKKQKDS